MPRKKSARQINLQLARITQLMQADNNIPNRARYFRAQDIAERYKTTMQANNKG